MNTQFLSAIGGAIGQFPSQIGAKRRAAIGRGYEHLRSASQQSAQAPEVSLLEILAPILGRLADNSGGLSRGLMAGLQAGRQRQFQASQQEAGRRAALSEIDAKEAFAEAGEYQGQLNDFEQSSIRAENRRDKAEATYERAQARAEELDQKAKDDALKVASGNILKIALKVQDAIDKPDRKKGYALSLGRGIINSDPEALRRAGIDPIALQAGIERAEKEIAEKTSAEKKNDAQIQKWNDDAIRANKALDARIRQGDEALRLRDKQIGISAGNTAIREAGANRRANQREAGLNSRQSAKDATARYRVVTELQTALDKVKIDIVAGEAMQGLGSDAQKETTKKNLAGLRARAKALEERIGRLAPPMSGGLTSKDVQGFDLPGVGKINITVPKYTPDPPKKPAAKATAPPAKRKAPAQSNALLDTINKPKAKPKEKVYHFKF